MQTRSQAEAVKHGLQHKFGNLTLFSSVICSNDIKWAGTLHFLQDMSVKNDSNQPAQMRGLIRVIAFHL